MKLITKVCAHCGKEYLVFPSRKNRSHYCSKACTFLAKQNPPVKKICPRCSATFSVSFLLRNHKTYCSRHCAGKDSVKDYRVIVASRPCAHCGTLYTPSVKHRKTSRFCSKTCFGKNNVTRETKACLKCGKTFTPARPDIKYCSISCRIGNKVPTVAVACLQCGTLFETARPKVSKLCSDSCANLYSKARYNKFALALEYLSYDPDLGLLYWKKSPGSKAPVGSVAGTPSTDGYRTFHLKKMTFKCNIVAWALYHGKWPSGFIDHKDGDTANDKIINLDEVTPSQNSYNQKPRSKSGYKGVYIRDNGTYRASVFLNGKNKSLGTYPTAREANQARLDAEKQHGVYEYAERGRRRAG